MKNRTAIILALSILAGILASRGQSQTNIYYTHVLPVSKTKSTCGVPNYYFTGEGTWKPSSIYPSNTWYYPTTNVLSISITNPGQVIEYVGTYGSSQCARQSLTWTDAFYPNQTYRFTIYWSNNIPLPSTNAWLPITTFGFKTNSP